MTEFKREDRFLVIKRKDLANVPEDVLSQFHAALDKINAYIPERQYVVVESDWPEYETVFKMIEERVESEKLK